jgi:hypothetical protein
MGQVLGQAGQESYSKDTTLSRSMWELPRDHAPVLSQASRPAAEPNDRPAHVFQPNPVEMTAIFIEYVKPLTALFRHKAITDSKVSSTSCS